MKNKEILIREIYGWKLYQKDSVKLWFNGYLAEERTVGDLLIESVDFAKDNDINFEKLSKWVGGLTGHFALIIDIPGSWCFSAVDRICSIPLYETESEREYIVTNYAPHLKQDDSNINLQSFLEISMSGYTLGKKTIYKNIDRFFAGECSLWINGSIYRDCYYTYLPYKGSIRSEQHLKSKFTDTVLSILKRTVESVKGRQIAIPLSAGNDSRLIASGLRELGQENVICFSYGRKGNYEIRTGQRVAERLGYKWVYVPDNVKLKRLFFLSEVYKRYINEFESYASVPNVQDVYEVYKLSLLDIIDKDAVIINGNTGDFISGGHISLDIDECNKTSSLNSFNWEPFLQKHYSIWGKLRTNINDQIIISELNKIAALRCGLNSGSKIDDYAVMECMESIGRQSRFVMNQQRAYEFIGHEWRIPLWDNEFLDFWEGVPPEYKVKQKLYKSVLKENNWGEVWKDIYVNDKLIRPLILLILRLIVKFIAAPFGKKRWHSLEKNVFVYWMHPSYARTVESYRKVLFDKRGQRNTNSWLADQFVRRNGFRGVLDVSRKIKKSCSR